MLYQVLDNGEPAGLDHPITNSHWKRSKFIAFDEAQEYVMNWLYEYGQTCTGIELNKEYRYGLYTQNNSIKIVEVKE
jgi:hypothetical protein